VPVLKMLDGAAVLEPKDEAAPVVSAAGAVGALLPLLPLLPVDSLCPKATPAHVLATTSVANHGRQSGLIELWKIAWVVRRKRGRGLGARV
jgi:hypothetical protein